MANSTWATIRGTSMDQSTGWEGHATAEGTAEYATGSALGFLHAPGHFRTHCRWGPEESPLTLSSLGTGTFLGDEDDKTDEAVENAIIRCVGDGWNVVDTAAVYRGGRGETAVGRALRALHLTGGCRRDQIFVSTKAGVEVSDADMLQLVVAEGAMSSSDIVSSDEGIFCLHPAWLEFSLSRSLRLLQLQTVDLFYLHNVSEGLLDQESVEPEEFWRQLRRAFEFCEAARKDGRIMVYGMATWDSLRVPPEHKLYVSLHEVVHLAEEVGGINHGFRGIQLPVNAHMREAWEEKWQDVDDSSGGKEKVTTLEAAAKFGVAVFSSGPLKEKELLEDKAMLLALDESPELANVQGPGAKLLQIARSVPGLGTVFVGHKTPAHVEENVALTRTLPLTSDQFAAVLSAALAPTIAG